MRLNRPPRCKVLITGFIFIGWVAIQPGLCRQAIAENQKSEVEEMQGGTDAPVERPVTLDQWSPDASAPRKFAGLDELHSGPISVEVRMARAAELENLELVTQDEALTILLGGIILVGAGLGAAGVTMAVPVWAVPALKGAMGLAATTPGGTALVGLEGYRQSVLEDSVAKVDFSRLTQTALRRRLRATEASPDDEAPERSVEVMILGYGLVRGPQADSACSFLQALIRLHLPGHDTQEDWVFIEPSRRSDDAPPPYCTTVKRFIANGGELVRQTWTESAEILAAIVARRLEDRR